MPAILTGRLPPTGTVVTPVDDYPQNLFTLLGGACRSTCTRRSPRCARALCAARANGRRGMQRFQDLGSDAYHLWRDFASPDEQSRR